MLARYSGDAGVSENTAIKRRACAESRGGADCQNTFAGLSSIDQEMDELLAVVSVLPIWKSKRALLSPFPFSVSVPVS